MIDPIERWHAYMKAGDLSLLDAMIAENAVFRSPAVHTPQAGKAITIKYLTAASQVLGNESFRYTGEWGADRSAVLEFECEVGGKQVNGVDIIAWGDDGLITDFKVMVRPLKGLMALVEHMGGRLAAA
ncbi:MAG TPA: nuclear transport factor 2 family protein [Sphingomicrobium sp.]